LGKTCSHHRLKYGECSFDMGTRTCRSGEKWVGRQGGKKDRSTTPGERQTLTWDQHSSTCGSSLWSHDTSNLRRQLKANRLALQTGIWDAVMVNSAPEYLLGVPRQAQRAIHQLRLNRLTSTALHQTFIGQITSPICPHCGTWRRQLNIYFSSVQTGQQNANGTLVTLLTSQMCSRTVTIWWNSSSLQGVCPLRVYIF